MRIAIILGAALAVAALAGCFTNEDAESTGPGPTGQTPLGPADVEGNGCTGDHVGAGNGDLGAPRACNETNETNASI